MSDVGAADVRGNRGCDHRNCVQKESVCRKQIADISDNLNGHLSVPLFLRIGNNNETVMKTTVIRGIYA